MANPVRNGPVYPGDETPASIAELWRRVQILEAVRGAGAGDYQFLAEEILADDTISDFDLAIPSLLPDGRAYRHLAVKVLVSGRVGNGSPTLPGDLQVSIDKEYTYAPQIVYASGDEPAAPYGTLAGDNETFVTLKNVLSFSDENVGNGPGYWSRLAFEFPYSREEGELMNVGGIWSAVGFGDLVGDLYSYGGSFASGGMITDPNNGPIDVFSLHGGRREGLTTFTGAWSAVTNYSPGDGVSSGGQLYIAVNPSLNVVPVPPDGGPDWDTFYIPLVAGTKISAYGIF